MRVLYSWLNDFIDLDLTPQQLEHKFTLLGIETAEIITIGANFSCVTAAKVIAIEQHPNADKLRLVTVDFGGETIKVVCGAPNVEMGMVTAFARVGAKLPMGTLEKAKIRGIESLGMLCSYKELGLEGDSSGIISFKDVAVGTDIASLYGKADYVFDLEITANKPEFLSHFGIARALAVLLDKPLKPFAPKKIDGSFESIKTTVADTNACERYVGRTFKNIKNQQSPVWMKDRLKAMNVNPKNALVDITNYVLFEIGYPLHIFDLDIIGANEINVRFSKEGEKFTTLMGDELVLNNDALLICDAQEPVALAGIMGGKKSGVNENTKNIFLEAAHFNPELINKTSKKLGIKSESSYRFERNADIEAAVLASDRAAQLLSEICGGEGFAISKQSDIYPNPLRKNVVFVDPAEINDLLGTQFDDVQIFKVLKALSPSTDINKTETEGNTKKGWLFTAPSYRPDIKTKWDIAEEVAVFIGYDSIPSDSRPVRVAFADKPGHKIIADAFLDALVGMGFCEAYNYDFISEAELETLGTPKEYAARVANPLSEDWKYMRPSLLPGLLKAAAFNKARSAEQILFCEIGRNYSNMKGHYLEQPYISGLMTGNWPGDIFWKQGVNLPIDFYHLKGVVHALLAPVKDLVFKQVKNAPKYMHPKICADITAYNSKIGYFGKLHPLVAQKYDLADVYVFEINTEALSKKIDIRHVKLEPVSSYPQSWRDLSLVMEDAVNYSDIEAEVKKAAGIILKTVSLTDLYRGANIGDGKKSVTLRLVFSSFERTLQDKEIDAAIEAVLLALKAKFHAALR